MRIPALLFHVLSVGSFLLAQEAGTGRAQFESRCAPCHGADANGGEHAAGIVTRLGALSDQRLSTVIRDGLPGRGMPGFNLDEQEGREIVAFLRSLRPARRVGLGPVRVSIQTTTGETLQGMALNYSDAQDLQLRTDDRRIHLLRKEGSRYRPVTSEADWTGYDGDPSGNRYSKLVQIDKRNVKRLAPAWVFALPNATRLQGTPVVAGGILYMTNANECYALDAGSGRLIWQFQRAKTRGLAGNAAGGMKRGAAVAGDRLFMVTDNAHLLGLNRVTGAVLRETEMADWKQSYNASSAPLVVGDLVVSGTAGGEQGVRGFLAAFDQATGKEDWRFWTVPKPGEPVRKPGQGVSSTAAPPPGRPEPTTPRQASSIGQPEIPARTTMATTVRATISIRHPSSPSMPKPGSSSGIFR
jgi:alcohol dehydrogenase (cytochrome c)